MRHRSILCNKHRLSPQSLFIITSLQILCCVQIYLEHLDGLKLQSNILTLLNFSILEVWIWVTKNWMQKENKTSFYLMWSWLQEVFYVGSNIRFAFFVISLNIDTIFNQHCMAMFILSIDIFLVQFLGPWSWHSVLHLSIFVLCKRSFGPIQPWSQPHLFLSIFLHSISKAKIWNQKCNSVQDFNMYSAWQPHIRNVCCLKN